MLDTFLIRSLLDHEIFHILKDKYKEEDNLFLKFLYKNRKNIVINDTISKDNDKLNIVTEDHHYIPDTESNGHTFVNLMNFKHIPKKHKKHHTYLLEIEDKDEDQVADGEAIKFYPDYNVLVIGTATIFTLLKNTNKGIRNSATLLIFLLKQKGPEENLDFDFKEWEDEKARMENDQDEKLNLLAQQLSKLYKEKAEQLKAIYEQMQDTRQEIKQKQQQLEALKQDYKREEMELLTRKKNLENKGKAEKLIKWLAKRQEFTAIHFHNTNNRIELTLEDVLLKNFNKEWLDQKKGRLFNTPDTEEFGRLFYEHIVEGQGSLSFGDFKLDIKPRTGMNATNKPFDIVLQSLDDYNNPHVRHGCLGDYEIVLNERVQEGDTMGVIRLIIEYLSSINEQDVGLSGLPLGCIIRDKDGRVVYDQHRETNMNRREITI